MGTLVLYASGHRYLYSSDEEEVCVISGENARARGGGFAVNDPEDPSLHWWPSSVDFRTEAHRHARQAIGVSNFQEFLRLIRSQSNIDTVLFLVMGAKSFKIW